MISLILKRLATAIPVLLAVITLTFFMVHSAPGGPFDEEKAVSPEVLLKLNERYNLNEPLMVQYFDYLVMFCKETSALLLDIQVDLLLSSSQSDCPLPLSLLYTQFCSP